MKNHILSFCILLSFNTFSQTVIDIDGNSYNTVVIGGVEWMAENLNVSHYKNGDVIPQITDNTQWTNATTGAWCYFNNNTANGPIYGKLYNFYAVNDSRGLAPDGWEVPTEEVCSDMFTIFDSTYPTNLSNNTVGKDLKEIGTAHWNAPNTGATNSSGFTAFGGAYRNNQTGTFTQPAFNSLAYFWTATEIDNPSPDIDFGRAFKIYADFDFVRRNSYRMDSGFYVRAIKSSTLSTVENNINDIKLYPNPATNFIKINGLTKAHQYTIYTILGTKVSTGSIVNNEDIETANLAKGLYFLIFNNGAALKFIKE